MAAACAATVYAVLCTSSLSAAAAEIGPPRPDTVGRPPIPWGAIPPSGTHLPAFSALRRLPNLDGDADETETIERVSGEDKGPRIPEPMVFDLVRPLGAKRGEWEVNALALFPLQRLSRRTDATPDPLGLVRRSVDREAVEWAPEIEYAFADGAAVEFEAPIEKTTLEAYKVSGQLTFGTAFAQRFIHGAQAIIQYDRNPSLWTATMLYLAGWRFDDTWSVFGMAGARGEVAGTVPERRAELLTNLTLFADLTPRLVAGLETNVGQVVGGDTSVLVMPQLHYEVSLHWMIQAGVGVRATTDLVFPEFGLRMIREF